MNDTKLTLRQKTIVNFLAQKKSASRADISVYLSSLYPVSKPTLARDIKELIDQKTIVSFGRGRQTVYSVISLHPLLIPVDLQTYFTVEPDQRKSAKKSFDLSILLYLGNLFSEKEKVHLEKNSPRLSQTVKKIDPTVYQRELERFVIELSWKSSKIEGNTYSLLETETLLKQSREASGHPKEEAIMILNHKSAFETILQKRSSFQNLSLSDVEQLHTVLVKNLPITTGMRKHAVGISGTVYKPPDNQWQIREAVQEAIQAINTIPYPLEKALISHAMIAYIQPFTDGNKRTARMLANAVLLAHDFYPLSYRSVDENMYKQALILFYETGNLYHVKRILVEQYQFALRTYFV